MYDFPVDYDSVNVDGILDIHKYLMKSDMVKHKLQVMSYELRVTSYELKA